ncbi:MAG: ribosome-associated protein [Acidimicrobiaceae bacterium]|nr:ribosome-associated protein [Acidimicrobiaceae bacterium]
MFLVSDVLRVTRGCAIPIDELTWFYTPSGGPGGQHANTSNTRVEVRFDVLNSPSLGPRQRDRLVERIGPVVKAVAGDERSQVRNKALALERLGRRLAEGLKTDRPRVATRPSKAAKERRVSAKRERSQVKQLRRRPADDE